MRCAEQTHVQITTEKYASVVFSAMHYSAKRDLAIACLLSVHLSVFQSVCDIGGL